MSVFKRVSLALVVLVIISCATAFWFIISHGRGLIIVELERLMGRKVSLEVVRPIFPIALLLEGVQVEGLAKIPKAVIVSNISELLKGHLQIASIEFDSPQINVDIPSASSSEKNLPAAVSTPMVSSGNAADLPGKPVLKRTSTIDLIKVRGGVVMVQVPSTGKTWIFDNVQAEFKNVPFDGASGKVDFFVIASLAKMNVPFVGHLVKARGWVNWAARDMDAKVEAVDEDGRVGLSAVLKSRTNDCEVKGRVRLSATQPAQASGKKPKMVEAVMLDLLSSLKTDIEAEFSFRTPLDQFEVGKVSISGNITTGLHSEEISGNIVGSLKAAGANMLQKDDVSSIKPFKK